jgi:hypothetical protein
MKVLRREFLQLVGVVAAAPQLLSDNHLLLGVDPMDLKHVLGDIQTDRGNLHSNGSPHVIRLRRSLYGTSMPGAGAVHHIRFRRPSTSASAAAFFESSRGGLFRTAVRTL